MEGTFDWANIELKLVVNKCVVEDAQIQINNENHTESFRLSAILVQASKSIVSMKYSLCDIDRVLDKFLAGPNSFRKELSEFKSWIISFL